MPQLPKRFQKFTDDYPQVAKAYKELGDAVLGMLFMQPDRLMKKHAHLSNLQYQQVQDWKVQFIHTRAKR